MSAGYTCMSVCAHSISICIVNIDCELDLKVNSVDSYLDCVDRCTSLQSNDLVDLMSDSYVTVHAVKCPAT